MVKGLVGLRSAALTPADGVFTQEGKLSFPNYGAASAWKALSSKASGTGRSFVKRGNRAFVVMGWVNWDRS